MENTPNTLNDVNVRGSFDGSLITDGIKRQIASFIATELASDGEMDQLSFVLGNGIELSVIVNLMGVSVTINYDISELPCTIFVKDNLTGDTFDSVIMNGKSVTQFRHMSNKYNLTEMDIEEAVKTGVAETSHTVETYTDFVATTVSENPDGSKVKVSFSNIIELRN